MLGDKIDRTILLSRSTAIGALALAFTLLLASSTLLVLNADGAFPPQPPSVRTQTILAGASRLLANLDDSTAALRRHLLAQDEATLATYRAAVERLGQDIRSLENDLHGHPDTEAAFRALCQAADRQLSLYETALAERRDRGLLAALDLIASETDRRFAADRHRALGALQRIEFHRLADSFASASARTHLLRRIHVAVILSALLLASLASWLLLRRMRDIEGLINICAWTRRVHWKGEWLTFEEYLARRFGLRCSHGISDEAIARLKAGDGGLEGFSSESTSALPPSAQVHTRSPINPAPASGT